MLKNNLEYNASVTSNTAFLESLREKLPEFFTADKNGVITSQATFDFEKFKRALTENSIQNELTSGYQLNFIGKDYAKKQAGEAPTTVVLPDKVHNEQIENQNSQNLFFTGDNLEVLRHLQASYENSIDVIYIDPPYNTGSDGFVYPDKFEYNDAKLQTMFGLNDEELERLKSIQGKATHSAWLTFMYPRLWLAKRLLKETGVIFVSIDDNEQANLKLLMDEIFGEGNSVQNFLWLIGKGKKDTWTRTTQQYILCYAKQKSILPSWRDTQFAQGNFSNLDNDPRGEWFSGSISFDEERSNPNRETYFTITSPSGKQWTRQWQVENKAEMDKLLAENRIYFGPAPDYANVPRKKIFPSDKISIIPSNLLENRGTSKSAQKEILNLFDNRLVFDTPKPSKLLKQLLYILDNKDATILDFFAGSSSTADAVIQLNAEDGGKRKFIMVQLPEPTFIQNSDGTKVARKGSEIAFNAGYQSIDEISRERIKRASHNLREERGTELPEGFDGGFKHYRVLEPSQATLDDLDHFDIETGQFIDSKGNQLLVNNSEFEDMITPFSSQSLGFDTGATGIDTILTTWMLADGYSILNRVEKLNFSSYTAFYLNSERLYLIADNWESEQTKSLVNLIGSNKKVIQTIVLYGYSFSLESIRELELALAQLDTKINLVKRY